MNKPLVSVCMITYNHEKYIEEAIRGVLMQKTDFEIEFLISNDASTDNTHTLIKQLAIGTKNIAITYINQPVNIGMMPNFIFALEQCKGKYIALCEGDDYWTDPLKLQKQVDFMEANPDYGICFHKVKVFNQEKMILEDDTITGEVPETTTIADLAKGNFIHTPSVLFRNNFQIPKWFTKVYTGDWTLYMLIIKDKKIKKIPEQMAIYRIHNQGIWSGRNSSEQLEMIKKTFTLVLKKVPLDTETNNNLVKLIETVNRGIKNISKSKPKIKAKTKVKNTVRPFYMYLKKLWN